MTFSLPEWSPPRRQAVQRFLEGRFLDAWPAPFQEACLYPIRSGGKRMRPLLTLAAGEAVGVNDLPRLVPVGASVELIHTYSLVHDDLPAMDDDDERRGKPTVHIAFDEATALLVGDACLTEAFAVLGEQDAPLSGPLTRELALAAGHRGMIAGQAMDIGIGGPIRSVDQLRTLHRGKTGALIRAAVRLGGIASGATAGQLEALTRYGEAVGLAFQLTDDVLDATEDAGADGPPSYVKLLGLTETQHQARTLLDQALEAAAELPAPEALMALARYTVDRDH